MLGPQSPIVLVPVALHRSQTHLQQPQALVDDSFDTKATDHLVRVKLSLLNWFDQIFVYFNYNYPLVYLTRKIKIRNTCPNHLIHQLPAHTWQHTQHLLLFHNFLESSSVRGQYRWTRWIRDMCLRFSYLIQTISSTNYWCLSCGTIQTISSTNYQHTLNCTRNTFFIPQFFGHVFYSVASTIGRVGYVTRV